MKEARTVLRAAMGGAICGGFLGIFGGGLLGVLGGIYLRNISLGLDGAITGGAVSALCGAIYGVVFHDHPPRLRFGRHAHYKIARIDFVDAREQNT